MDFKALLVGNHSGTNKMLSECNEFVLFGACGEKKKLLSASKYGLIIVIFFWGDLEPLGTFV